LRHSLSSSYTCVSAFSNKSACGAFAAPPGANWTYFDVEVPVNLDGVSKQADVLRQVGELPHIAQLLQCARSFDWLLSLQLVVGALSGRHREERAGGDASGDGSALSMDGLSIQ
jgi:hypothetical protein